MLFESSIAVNPDEIHLCQKIILENRLCYFTGSMRRWCQYPADMIDCVALATEGDRYIGAAMLLKRLDLDCGSNVGCFVAIGCRRLGVGRQLMNLIDNSANVKIVPWKKELTAQYFYDNVLKAA